MKNQHITQLFTSQIKTDQVTSENKVFSSPLAGEDAHRAGEGYVKEEALNKNDFRAPLRSGFTLIELLVVVLIIGILASVALPQYQVAVAKSRVASILALGKAMAEAQEVYHLANGQYAKDIRDLDLDLPADCKKISNFSSTSTQTWACGNDFFFSNEIGFSRDSIKISYCPNQNKTWSPGCLQKRDLAIFFDLHHNQTNSAGKRTCEVQNSSKLGQTICNSLAGFN